MFIRFDAGDGRRIETDECFLIPGVGVVLVDAERIEHTYPWHRIFEIEREAATASSIVVPQVIPGLDGGRH